MELDVAEIPVRLRYNLMIGAIVPRPIAVVGTCDAAGRPNLAPFSFFMGCGSDPMTLVVSVANPPGGAGEKDTLRNAKPVAEGGTGEFTVSVATEGNISRVVACAEPLAHGESEFALAGLTPVPGSAVRAPRPAESPVTFECRTLQVVRMAPGREGASNLLVGQVVRVHVAEGFANERMHVDADLLRAVGRMGGSDYCTTRERAAIPAGRPALTHPAEWRGHGRPDAGR
jgi:flavin reductase (DIM6/NTAB) family NADH-FMN oxidoreductase RutF